MTIRQALTQELQSKKWILTNWTGEWTKLRRRKLVLFLYADYAKLVIYQSKGRHKVLQFQYADPRFSEIVYNL